ncbi:hypothetical protein CB0940_09197 [Cercospora beticola]|uniref:Acyltransferase 3 domain-containing protein n=1 Tax=Cercospora beticola TaxID=122368 RepID=A0A2G5HGM0_CERBT|nr:hypothetical protein CB0940_09197 [Cercospora beticola]PIA91679.1 hypothetical protein CB0940_09197 [Cercospora beticola]WPB06508.1 hypothetical protein RHO25_011165 [Cercospora beticola]CAK1366415.1 unnamed protein product [Cercospora beticola]
MAHDLARQIDSDDVTSHYMPENRRQHSSSTVSIASSISNDSESSQTARPLLRTRISNTIKRSYSLSKPLELFQRLRLLLPLNPAAPPNTPTTSSPPPPPAQQSPSRTASYDGLRGIACLIVFNFHFLYPYTKTITHGFAVERNPNDPIWNHPHQLPVICLLVRGRAMVTLFFAISGYVLSYNFLESTLHSNDDPTKRWTRLSSLTFRRWMRLFLPATISMTIVMFASFIGAFDSGREFQKSSEWLTGWWEQHPPRMENFGAQLQDFAKMWWDWQTPFQWRLYYSLYDPHTWTIPVEFRGSLVLFVVLLGSAGLKQGWRMGVFGLVTGFCFASKRWDAAAFVGGALVADLHLWEGGGEAGGNGGEMDEKDCLPRWKGEGKVAGVFTPRITKYVLTAIKTMLLVASLWILSFPDDEAWKTPGFSWLNDVTPSPYKTQDLHPYKFWHAFAAAFVLWSIQRLSYVQGFFCLSVPQYLGKISYAFYLVHGPLLHGAGFALQPRLFEALGAADSTAKWVGCLILGWVTMLTLSIIVAHLFWMVVDVPLVKFAKWMERKVSH